MTALVCPRCERRHDGECEVIHRGRRFFFLGALALPVAARIHQMAKVIIPPEQLAWISGSYQGRYDARHYQAKISISTEAVKDKWIWFSLDGGASSSLTISRS